VALYGALTHVVAEGVVGHEERITGALAEAGVHVRAMDVIPPSLEDVFISSVRNHTESRE
jgi:hypothetical protein